MLRAGIFAWVVASVPLSVLMGGMIRASMPADPGYASSGEQLPASAASGP
ncbi:MAG: hypothetical protein ACR2MO_16630 [Acidimicrobiales bacterium]